MIQLLAASSLFLALSGCTAPATSAAVASTPSPSGPVQVTEAQNGQTVQLAADSFMIITLPSNPSTGYGWYVAETPPGLHSVSQDYVPDPAPASSEPIVGRGGVTRLRFHAAEGAGTLRLAYRRAQPADAPAAQTFQIQVVIR